MSSRPNSGGAVPRPVGNSRGDESGNPWDVAYERSAATFGNRYFASVLAAAEQAAKTNGYFTVRDLARLTGVQDSLVRGVVLRAVTAEVLLVGRRVGGPRSPLYYTVGAGSRAKAVLAAARAVLAGS